MCVFETFDVSGCCVGVDSFWEMEREFHISYREVASFFYLYLVFFFSSRVNKRCIAARHA